MRFASPSPHAVVLAVSVGAATLSALGYGVASAGPKTRGTVAGPAAASYVPSVEPWTLSDPREWKLSDFELFGPPTPAVVATRPSDAGKVEALAIELVAIRPESFCVRLIGIVGQGVDRRGVFEDIATGEIRLGRPGDTLRRQVHIDAIEARGIAATAIVRTLDSNRAVELNAGATAYTSERVATIRDATGIREVRPGDVVANGAETYEVESIAEASVTLRQQSGDESTAARHELPLRPTEESR